MISEREKSGGKQIYLYNLPDSGQSQAQVIWANGLAVTEVIQTGGLAVKLFEPVGY